MNCHLPRGEAPDKVHRHPPKKHVLAPPTPCPWLVPVRHPRYYISSNAHTLLSCYSRPLRLPTTLQPSARQPAAVRTRVLRRWLARRYVFRLPRGSTSCERTSSQKLSPSEKRTLRREEVLEDLSQRRQIQAPPGSANSPSAVQPSAARLANRYACEHLYERNEPTLVMHDSAPAITHQKDTTQTSKSAFHPNWRRSLQGQSRSQSATPSTNHSKTPGSARSGTPQTSKNQHPNGMLDAGQVPTSRSSPPLTVPSSGSRRPATAARYVEDDDPDFEELGGLRDVDVAADRNATLATSTCARARARRT